ncbi:MAG: GTP 3',8-cyclase MoaA [Thermoanaerobaculia bacterium]|nr:GTP 3',8-cyclase MoaA [Thermoanaerobaculia bacterium]
MEDAGALPSRTTGCTRPGQNRAERLVPPEPTGLTDPIGRRITYLRLSILESCNLRCTYCRPAGEAGVAALPPAMEAREIVRLAALFVSLGVRKVRLTGGEPTLHAGLVSIVRALAALEPRPPILALTTNGVLLPRLARPLSEAGLSQVNVSLDATTRESFRAMTGRDRLDAVRSGIDAALAAGFSRVKINAVILAGQNEDQVVPLALLARDLPVDVRFIEYMPMPGVSAQAGKHLAAVEIERRLAERFVLEEVPKEADAGPARMVSVQGFRGRIGLISPFSVKFCSDCNRLRVTARGSLRLCLLGGGEVDLLDPIRRGLPDEALAAIVRDALRGKAERHPFETASAAAPPCATPMWAVGG